MTGSGGIFAGENPIKPENAISLLMVQVYHINKLYIK